MAELQRLSEDEVLAIRHRMGTMNIIIGDRPRLILRRQQDRRRSAGGLGRAHRHERGRCAEVVGAVAVVSRLLWKQPLAIKAA